MKHINKAKYSFYEYNDKYPKLFKKEERKIKKVLPNCTIVEHVGSTSVYNLGGKGIVDIAIKLQKKDLKKFIEKLKKIGFYRVLQHKPDKNRTFLQKIIRNRGKERRVHLHLVHNKYYFNTFTAVRDYLRIHKKEREQYAQLKKDAVKHAKGEGKKYRAYKSNFLERITKKALKEFKLKW